MFVPIEGLGIPIGVKDVSISLPQYVHLFLKTSPDISNENSVTLYNFAEEYEQKDVLSELETVLYIITVTSAIISKLTHPSTFL